MGQKPSYEKLEQRVKELEAFIRLVPDMLCVAGEDGYFKYLNPEWEKTLGYSVDELMAKPFVEFVHPDDRDATFTEFDEVLAGRGARNFRNRYRCKDGSYKILELRGTEDIDGLTYSMARDVTEQVHTGNELRSSEERLRLMTENSVDVIRQLDLSGNVVYVSPTVEKLSGYTPEETLHKGYDDLMDETDRHKAIEAFKQVIKLKKPHTVEVKVFKKNGEPIFIESSLSPMIRNGKITGLVGVSRDITKRKKIETELKKRNRFIETLMDNIPIGVATYRISDEETLYVNKKFEEIYGWPMEEISNLSAFFEKVFPRQEGLKNRVIADMASKKPEEMYWAGLQSMGMNGEKKFVTAKNIPLYEQDLMIATAQDITQQHYAQSRLKESEEKYRNVVDNIKDGVWSVDAEGYYTFMNQEAEKESGITNEMLSRKINFLDILSPVYREIGIENFSRILKGETLPPYEIQYDSLEGITHTAETHVTPLYKDGKVVGAIGVSRDLTERRKLEEEQLILRNRLRQSQKMEAISTLAGGIAHQFNNALSVITGNIDLVKMVSPHYDDIKEYISPMEKSVVKMAQLTQQLLAYARGGKYHEKEIFLCDFVKSALPIIQPSLQPFVVVDTDLSDEQMKVLADETQLQMVLSAILSNASDAIENSGRIRIHCKKTFVTDKTADEDKGLHPGTYAGLTIIDNGKGMDEEILNRIFEPFFTSKIQGRGLGLAAVYGIIKNHGGWIGITSAPGDGTTVNILFPMVENATS